MCKYFDFNKQEFNKDIKTALTLGNGTFFDEKSNGNKFNWVFVAVTKLASSSCEYPSACKKQIVGIIRVTAEVVHVDGCNSNKNDPKMKVHEEKVGYIGRFYVSSEYQNNGIGTKLFEAALNKCEEIKCDRIRLVTASTMIAAHKTYKKYQFKVCMMPFDEKRKFCVFYGKTNVSINKTFCN